MLKNSSSSSVCCVCIGLVSGLLLGVAVMIGTVVALGRVPSMAAVERHSPFPVHSQMLHAASANSGKTMAMATGPIHDDAEGLYVLDFLTGDLYCWVIFTRNPWEGYIGQFKANVVDALGLEKGKPADYIITTGQANIPRGRAGAAPPARSICYVADCNSGKVAAYLVGFNPAVAAAGTLQKGKLQFLGWKSARPKIDADQ